MSRIWCIIILVLCIGCVNTDKPDNNINYIVVDYNDGSPQVISMKKKDIYKTTLFYFWVITGGM